MARRSEKDFTRQRSLPLSTLVPLLLNFRKGAIRDELDQFTDALAADGASLREVTDSAFCRARRKLKPEALEHLNRILLESATSRLQQKRWHGFRLLAVGGSTARLPATDAIAEHFGGPKDCGVPMARFSRLYDVLNGLVIQADMVPYHTGERELAAAYLLETMTDDLTLYDRGYPAFWLFAFHHVENRHYCAQVKHDFHPEVENFLQSSERTRTTMMKPGRSAARKCRDNYLPVEALPVRLIRVELNSGETEVLITSLRDTEAYPTTWFSKLYALRWGVEENYKQEKLRMEIENFSGLSPHVVYQDLYAKIIAQNLSAIMVFLAQWLANELYGHRKHAYKINCANALSKMKNTLARMLMRTIAPAACWRLLQRIATSVEAVRPNRSYPRDMKKIHVNVFHPNYKRCR